MLHLALLALAQSSLAPDTLESGQLAGFTGAKFGDTIEIDGDTALITAPVTSEGTSLSGLAYTYEYVDGAWMLDQRLDAPGFVEYQDFGSRAALSGDTAVITSRYMDTASGNNSGGAVVFERQAGVWTRTAELLPPAGSIQTLYGYGVALEGDLAVLVAQDKSLPFLVFERTAPGLWNIVDEIQLSPTPLNDTSFYQPRIQGDTLYLPNIYASTGGVSQTGEIQVFERGPAGWTLEQTIRTSPPVQYAYLGLDFDLDGDTLVSSSPHVPNPGGPSGAVFVFERHGGLWSQVQQFNEPLANAVGRFGDAIALSGDLLLVGEPQSNGGYPGNPAYPANVYSYERIDGSFTLALRTSDPAGIPAPYVTGPDVYGTYFGATLALSGDRALIGAPFDDRLFTDAGQAYAFDLGRLATDTPSLSLLAGGTQELTLQAGLTFANHLHVVLGSASGTAPGLMLDGVLLPLNLDNYLATTATNGAGSPLTGAVGTLDAFGLSSAQLSLPPASNPTLAGIQAHHAYVIIDPTVPAIVAASEADAILLLP